MEIVHQVNRDINCLTKSHVCHLSHEFSFFSPIFEVYALPFLNEKGKKGKTHAFPPYFSCWRKDAKKNHGLVKEEKVPRKKQNMEVRRWIPLWVRGRNVEIEFLYNGKERRFSNLWTKNIEADPRQISGSEWVSYAQYRIGIINSQHEFIKNDLG